MPARVLADERDPLGGLTLMISAAALERLREGNRQFVASLADPALAISKSNRLAPANGQAPFAIVLGCSDSRVPAELVFGQGFGDLFVIRVAGNIVAPSQVGSVEFAAARFGTKLVVVLGHTECGAVTATIEELRQAVPQQSAGLRAIVDRIRPAVEPLLATPLRQQPEALVAHAVRANIRAAADHLRHGSAILERLAERDGLVIVGAEYCLGTGVVEFFDGVPEAAEMLDRQPTLIGELLELRPLRQEDWAALFAVASDPLIWEQHPDSDRYKEDVFRQFFADALGSGGALVAIDRATGQIIGSSRYHAFDATARVIEIGWTFLARRYWGGRYNGEMKRLMLQHAFQAVDQVVFIIGPENRRSRRAVEKIGAVYLRVALDARGRERVVYGLTKAAFGQGR